MSYYYKIYLLFMMNFFMLIMNMKNMPMMIYLIILMILIMPFNFKFMNPLMININIIIFTIFMSIYLNYLNKSNWFSMLIFLVMIGGMMILFLYLNSFAINENSSLNSFFLKNLELKMMTIFLLNLIVNNSFYMNFFMKNIILENFKMKIYLMNEQTIILIFSKSLNMMLIFMIIYLLINLMVITYICMSKKSSMRKMN
uniref:NADH dehydrogenase subunit 6 n=1 Tax=Trissolcus japonicus TaxID=1388796 RepID=A0A8E7PG92_9HYME|nr:NADH dehydrogenase subunit 6 [Trissolcus japonicus]